MAVLDRFYCSTLFAKFAGIQNEMGYGNTLWFVLHYVNFDLQQSSGAVYYNIKRLLCILADLLKTSSSNIPQPLLLDPWSCA